MANEKDSCKAKLSLDNYNSADDAAVMAELNGFTTSDIEKAGKGSGLVFCPPKDTILEFPATRAEAKIDVDTFETSDKKKVPVLYGRVYMCGTWQWFPLSAFRRVPVDEYVFVDKDGVTHKVNEKLAFFENNDIGRDLAEVRKSDLDVYTSLVGNKYRVSELFIGHRQAFDKQGQPIKGEFKIMYCFKLAEVE